MYAYELDKYVAGYRFSDESDVFRDSSSQEFKDLSSFSSLGQNCKNLLGSQVFENIGGDNNRRGLVIDGSNHLELNNPVAWGGSFIAAFKVEILNQVTESIYPMIDGKNPTVTNNSYFQLSLFSGDLRANWLSSGTTPGAQETVMSAPSSEAIIVIARSISQEDSVGLSTTDGVTVVQSSTVPDGNAKGILLSPCRGRSTRLGNLNGIFGDQTVNSNIKLTMLEMHFFKDNIIGNQLPKTKLLIEELKAYYA